MTLKFSICIYMHKKKTMKKNQNNPIRAHKNEIFPSFTFHFYIERNKKNKRVWEEVYASHEEEERKFFIQIDCKLIKSAFTLGLFLILSCSLQQQVDFLCLFSIADDSSSYFLIFFSFIRIIYYFLYVSSLYFNVCVCLQ